MQRAASKPRERVVARVNTAALFPPCGCHARVSLLLPALHAQSAMLRASQCPSETVLPCAFAGAQSAGNDPDIATPGAEREHETAGARGVVLFPEQCPCVRVSGYAAPAIVSWVGHDRYFARGTMLIVAHLAVACRTQYHESGCGHVPNPVPVQVAGDSRAERTLLEQVCQQPPAAAAVAGCRQPCPTRCGMPRVLAPAIKGVAPSLRAGNCRRRSGSRCSASCWASWW